MSGIKIFTPKVKLFELWSREDLDNFEGRINDFLKDHPGNVHFVDYSHVYIYYEEDI